MLLSFLSQFMRVLYHLLLLTFLYEFDIKQTNTLRGDDDMLHNNASLLIQSNYCL